MSNEQREQQMMDAADRYADEVCDESCTGAQVAETINDFCAGWRAADSYPNWISVEDELPELTIDDWRSENVFFATDDSKSHFGFYSNKGVWFSSVYGFNGHQVTHWMPLPEAPRKEARNDNP